ncbi:MAG: hypothetical protein JWP08_3441 [Bryobacterales bacterium]|nr:hypothetical protein [Bryobacterales bacterium]
MSKPVRNAAKAGLEKQPDNSGLVLCAIKAATVLGERDSVSRLLEQKSGTIRGDHRRQLDSEELCARMLARSGAKAEVQEAIPLLDHLLHAPYDSPWTHVPLMPALLRLAPDFDSLRGDPCFQKPGRQ